MATPERPAADASATPPTPTADARGITSERPAPPSASTLPESGAAPALVYRPISGLAIAGLACAVFYAGLVLLSLSIAFFQREPLLLSFWLLLLPGAGALLGFLALSQIRNSEGTRAGALLARWSIWVSVLSGVGSATFTAFTGLAINQQANRFLMEKGPDAGFFPRLLDGDVNSAFLLTTPPRLRRGTNPNDPAAMERFDDPLPKGTKGAVTLFRESELVRALRKTSEGAAQVEPLGVRSWSYEDKGYQVERGYRIKNAEGVFEAVVRVQSRDSDVPGEGRKWTVLWRPGDQLTPLETTDFGKKLTGLRVMGYQFATVFLVKLQQTQWFEAYLDTRAPDEREGLRKKGAAASPGFKQFSEGKDLLHTDRLQGVEVNTLKHLRELLPQQLFGKGAPPNPSPQLPAESARTAEWEKGNGKISISFDLEFLIPPAQAGAPALVLFGKLTVETDENALRGSWRVTRLEFERVTAMRLPKQ